jgi:hypothetical protein
MIEMLYPFECLDCHHRWSMPAYVQDPCPMCNRNYYWNLSIELDDLTKETFKRRGWHLNSFK